MYFRYLTEYLESIGGESIVAFLNGTRVKLHVHTFTPEKVLEYCRSFGEFISVKIENMSVQHSDAKVENRFVRQKPVDNNRKKYGCVTVADGEGLIEVFKQFGADFVVDGKQTMNPSTEDFIKAFDSVNADNIFVLPNNSNILLTAKQAALLYDKSNVVIIPSKTIAEGYAAFTMLDYTPDDTEAIAEQFRTAIEGVTTGLVTYAVRDCSLHGIDIKKGEWLGFSGKEIINASDIKTEAACRLLDNINMDNKEVIIAICGNDTTADETEAVRSYVQKNFGNIEYYEVDGGQDIYSFIFAVE